jgi:hypothetical protein
MPSTAVWDSCFVDETDEMSDAATAASAAAMAMDSLYCDEGDCL